MNDNGITRAEFLKAVQRFVVNVGVSGSSLRNQGSPGVVAAARKFLSQLDLTPLIHVEPAAYPAWLDDTTSGLLTALPENARKWGAARKATNILTTQAFLNAELSKEFNLSRLGDLMETPLDSVAADELRRMPGGEKLPRWLGVGGLTQEASAEYQTFALALARSKGVPRACLDVFLWRPLVE